MQQTIKIRQLSEQETATLIRSDEFNNLQPSLCRKCGNRESFSRMVFWIGGVPKAKQKDNDTRSLIAYHLKQREGIEHVFFKNHSKRFYADSARCTSCGSTTIEFDIELTDEMIAVAAKLVGRSFEEVKREMAIIAERLAQGKEKGK
ncbi:MAG: hypothetical protein EI684_12335 [Candidatus Viridilinea halotolerans]|uniref:Uncharacterized protein n=1 Tax=Candidatus Viridilinea halotolerans TaxID=2491704 RepID=A0A426TYP0_9CHLR|nr:MAG: hypothetical protein EI684_12335 [Candidatus Viridilinea halotolerans]